MRNKIFGALALSTLAALSLGGAALAKGGPGHHGGKGIFGPGMHHVLAELDLSEEQQALAKELRDEARANHESERAEREQAMDSALTELAKAEPDSAEAILKEKGLSQADLEALMYEVSLDPEAAALYTERTRS